MKLLATVCLILFVTVGISFTIGRDDTPPNVNVTLKPIVDQWQDEMVRAGIEYTHGFNRVDEVQIGNLNGDLVGLSTTYNKTIMVDRRQLVAGPYSTWCTLYHELGHAVFHLSHESCIIMNERTESEEFYRDEWPKILAEYLATCRANEFEAKY